MKHALSLIEKALADVENQMVALESVMNDNNTKLQKLGFEAQEYKKALAAVKLVR